VRRKAIFDKCLVAIDECGGSTAERKEDTLQQVQPPRVHFTDFTCTGCGCLCDDLAIALSDTGKPEIENINCSLASRFLEREVEHLTRAWTAPAALAMGEAAPLRKALYVVESLLSWGRRPRARVIFGATESSLEAQRAAVRLADLVSATMTVGPNLTGSPRWLARQRAGWVSATWGEIRQRADLVLMWDLDPGPDGTHPRFAERFLDRPGRFVPEGASNRTVLRLSTWTDPAGGRSSDSISVPPSGLLALLSGLRALIRGRAVDPARLEVATGRSLDSWA
jgi:formylmethanofuran dehydrogenase subunit B